MNTAQDEISPNPKILGVQMTTAFLEHLQEHADGETRTLKQLS
jgi:hypothetical protein